MISTNQLKFAKYQKLCYYIKINQKKAPVQEYQEKLRNLSLKKTKEKDLKEETKLKVQENLRDSFCQINELIINRRFVGFFSKAKWKKRNGKMIIMKVL